MCLNRLRVSAVKAVLFIVLFVPVHFLFDLWPSPLTAFFSENGGESIFQHMKIGFWAWVLASVAEFLLFFRKAPRKYAFVESRALGLFIIPFTQTVVWYLAPAFFGRIASTAVEVAWSCLACFIAGLGTSVVEWDSENSPSTYSRRAFLIIAIAMELILFTRFTYGGLPWVDVFSAPPSK
jgi:hypothetical protein